MKHLSLIILFLITSFAVVAQGDTKYVISQEKAERIIKELELCDIYKLKINNLEHQMELLMWSDSVATSQQILKDATLKNAVESSKSLVVINETQTALLKRTYDEKLLLKEERDRYSKKYKRSVGVTVATIGAAVLTILILK